MGKRWIGLYLLLLMCFGKILTLNEILLFKCGYEVVIRRSMILEWCLT